MRLLCHSHHPVPGPHGRDRRTAEPRGELLALPADTVLLKKRYRSAFGSTVFVSVVISGSNPRSIHRPQQCLPAQGNSIEASDVVDIPRAGRGTLRVIELLLRRPSRASNRRLGDYYSLFSYWFVNPVAETPYTFGRILYSLRDRVLFCRNYRWAYVAIHSEASVNGLDSSKTQLRKFIAELYPMLHP